VTERSAGEGGPAGAGSSRPHQRSAKRVAVMQPYFFPYAGYFRLFCGVDEFILFDCVQFPRRGRVHRSEVPDAAGASEWLTLPLAWQPRDVLIKDLAFAPDARARFDRRLERFAWVRSGRSTSAERIRAFLFAPLNSVIDYLEQGLRLTAEVLGLNTTITRSSRFQLAPSLRGQSRVIAAAQSAGATHYLNPPGGRSLYDASAFERAALQLSFLPPYQGQFFHLLPALLTLEPELIRADIRATGGPAAVAHEVNQGPG
jgi:WbqC-like protein